MVDNMNLKEKAKTLKREIGTLYYAYKDNRTPLIAKILAIIVVSYALSPIDLIPDFIPVIGYLDDFILLPLGIYLVLKMIPSTVIEDSKAKAIERFEQDKNVSYFAAVLIILVWLVAIYFLIKINYAPN